MACQELASVGTDMCRSRTRILNLHQHQRYPQMVHSIFLSSAVSPYFVSAFAAPSSSISVVASCPLHTTRELDMELANALDSVDGLMPTFAATPLAHDAFDRIPGGFPGRLPWLSCLQ
jgi:hypothetical protein